MKITEEHIPLIEKALNITLYDGQKQYLLHNGDYWFGGRRTGKTMAYCIKLALSEGKPIVLKHSRDYIDSDYGPPSNLKQGIHGGLRTSLWTFGVN